MHGCELEQQCAHQSRSMGGQPRKAHDELAFGPGLPTALAQGPSSHKERQRNAQAVLLHVTACRAQGAPSCLTRQVGAAP